MSTYFDVCLLWARNGRWSDLIALANEQPAIANETDASGRTLLIYCAGFAGSSSAIRALVGLGADPNHHALDNSTALAAAISGGSTFGLTTLPELAALLDVGADPRQIANCGMPALHWAISQGRIAHAKLLLERGADVTQTTSDNPAESVGEIAARTGSNAAAQLLRDWQAG